MPGGRWGISAETCRFAPSQVRTLSACRTHAHAAPLHAEPAFQVSPNFLLAPDG